ncbi:Mo-dependent nitrogenase [Stenomitos frigidus ULC18]|uniref:Mo-dependent nitrogenase n=2 Tax=Stenomitos TaxID=1844270 RepID=A0A2T1DYE7_9CYAN|nr:Mo-dependent nitrogenase [Stenomitos frigidus ULC18]
MEVASEPALRSSTGSYPEAPMRFAPLQPIRQWLANIELGDRKTARSLCVIIPAQCPFERTVQLFGRTLLAIPPLCKLNPFYDELVALRFRALCYLADVCGEDVSPFC